MPDMKYEAELVILYVVVEGDNRSHEKLSVPVKSFSVDGGANRTIDLKSTDDVSVASELEQARTHKNFNVFIPPTNDFRSVKLVQLHPLGGNIKFFSFTFVVCVYVKGRKVQTLRLTSEDAWFIRPPTPVGGTPPLLTANVVFREAQLLHGQFDPKRNKLVYKEM